MYKGSENVLEALSKSKSRMSLEQLANATVLNVDSVRRIVESLKDEGYVSVESKDAILFSLTPELLQYCGGDFPELAVYKKAAAGVPISGLSPAEKSIGIRWAKVKGLVQIEAGKLVPSKTPEEANALTARLHSCCGDLKAKGSSDDLELVEEFFERKLLDKKVLRTTLVSLTGKPLPDISTSISGGFDVNVPGKNASIGKTHPVTKITNRMKNIMSELGFQELEGDIIESSFWNFDALFQPQDHPARELADTFYIDGDVPLPSDSKLVERIKKAHEGGWKYKWNPKEASKRVLRTHTTCLSARALASIKAGDKSPKKYFAIGRVFRNEATDYKHLAEFHQVEGIIAWEKATFTDLLGVLKEFYSKLGFEKIRFRPSFFPYTEPSLEIEVYFEERKQWLELGGAGIFRPEVSIPLAGVYPVLAWGLSLERPLMLALELEDIRTFYRNDLDFLMKTRLDI